ncbi:MAG: S8 family serine peptidase [Candidatus Thorarchaeota archaeon]|nr:S8 family serine peptidase [Candidatus Thorarchaeota archaeon]
MSYKRTAAVLLFIAALSLTMFVTPATRVNTAEPASAPTLSPEAKEQLQQWYQDVAQPGYQAKVDPALAEWVETGVLSEKVVKTADGGVSALLVLAPWADEAKLADLVEVQWKADLKYFKVWQVTFSSTSTVSAVAAVSGVGSIEADQYKLNMADDLQKHIATPSTPEQGVDIYHIRQVVGAETAPASSYNGTGVYVGQVDTGADFGNPDLQGAYGAAYDPSGYGLVPTFYHANSTPVNVTEWSASPYNLLTYEGSDGNIYLDVSGWDPLLNYEGGGRYLIGDGDENAPYHKRVGFIWLYAYYWGIEGAGNLINNYLWKDWCLPDPSNVYGNYSVNFVMQQRWAPYAKIFAPALVINSTADKQYHLIINWEDTMGWNKLWTAGFYYESIDLTNILDAYDVIKEFDWNFTDDFVEETFSKANRIVAHDYDGDSIDDFSLGALCYVYDAGEWFDTEPYFDAFRADGDAFALYYDAGTHGTATASQVAGQGVLTYKNTDTGATFKMTGVAPGAKIYSVRGLTSGSVFGGFLWACGFDLNATSGEFEYTGHHLSNLVTNSWGWVADATSEFSYMSMTWTILSVPNLLDSTYPGVLHVFSAGNEGAGYMTVAAPGCASGVLTVGASTTSHWLEYLYGPTQPYEGIASFTSKGPDFSGYPKPDVLAPGLAGYAAVPWYNQFMGAYWGSHTDEYTVFAGTSQAAPVAAGVAALLFDAANNALTSFQAKIILQQTAVDLGYDPATQGFGRIDAARAVDFYVNNVGRVSANLDSAANIAKILQDAWKAGGILPSSLLGTSVNTSAVAFPDSYMEGSLFFGNVWPGTTSTIYQSIMDNSSALDNSGWSYSYQHFVKAETFQFTGTTFAYVDANVSGDYAYGYFNLREELGHATYDSNMSTYKYVTIGVAFAGDAATGGEYPWMFLYDWEDTNVTDGYPNLWNGTDGNELHRLTSASNPSNTNFMSFADATSDLASVLSGNMTMVIHDPVFDVNATYVNVSAPGHDFVATVTFWKVTDPGVLSAAAGGTTNTVNFTLTVPANAEAGIHTGYVIATKGSTVIKLPFSYNVVANLSADVTTPTTVVDGFGSELTPYDAPLYCLASDSSTADFRSYLVYNPHNASYMGVRAIWDEPGSQMFVEILDHSGSILASGGASTATTTAVIANLGSSPVGYYYIFVYAVALNGTTFLPVNYTLEAIMYESLTGGANDVILTYTANDVTTPVAIHDGDTIVGDHAVVNATYPKFNLPNMPEYEVDYTKISFLSGVFYQHTGNLVIPSSSYNPFSGTIDLTQFAWERVDGIKAGDNVDVKVDFTNGDCDIMMWWADTDNSSWSYANNLMADKMATGNKPEHGSFTADRDGSIMIGIFDYDLSAGQYTVTVDTRVGVSNQALGATVTFDSYSFLKNGSFQVQILATTMTNINFEVNLAELTFQNFFSPDVTNVQISKSGNVVTITWTATDRNAGDDLYFDILMSPDSGLTWQYLAVNQTGNSYVWDSSSFLALDTYMIRVDVYDNDPVQNPTVGPGDYWMGLTDTAYSSVFSAGAVTTTPTPTTSTTTTATPPGPGLTIDPLIIGLIGGIGVGVVIILILFLVKKK